VLQMGPKMYRMPMPSEKPRPSRERMWDRRAAVAGAPLVPGAPDGSAEAVPLYGYA
jgi:hypothetical protein